jgi:hypothetical protein
MSALHVPTLVLRNSVPRLQKSRLIKIATQFVIINLRNSPCLAMSKDSSVGIATGYGFDDQGVGVRVPM